MLTTTQANVYEVQVGFHPQEENKFSFGGDMVDKKLKIAPGIQMINFRLSTHHAPEHPSASMATFVNDPITWEGTPPIQPAQGLGEWFGESRCSAVIFSLNDAEHTFGFKIAVSYEGTIHESHDPSIINDPPIGG